MFLDNTIKQVLTNAKTIAVIGAKDKPNQPVTRVCEYLIQAGYTIFPIHPVRSTVFGLPVYKCVADLPQPVDIINVFRAPEFCAAHAQEVVNLSWQPLCFWMQEGIRSSEAGKILAAKHIQVLEDICIKIEHERLLGAKNDTSF